ncbi:asparaginase [Corynebacterium glutamicum]|uniref:Asparaginase n=1 Tax=Corynebacterium glutamicum (strain R) TaxID=340322 RepID=A0AB72VDZ5_CORGB|nr:asparaginase [Corynebacterium glutamicum]BAF55827.1 hypothetical protein cgR_2808 [Corynebacterium glutamicum R]
MIPAHAPLVGQTRGDHIESIHYGSAVLLDVDGNIETSIGDTEAVFYPRSALKPLFAVGMVRAGLKLNQEQLTLASASHSGSLEHQRIVLSTLHDAGLTESDLGNSVDLPYGKAEREAHLAAGGRPTRLAQNCSGKHAALLALCVLKGWGTENYLDPEHPISALLRETVEELCGTRVASTSIDGCGTPVYPLTLAALARGYARLAKAQPGSAEYQVKAAIVNYPELLAGVGRDVSALMRALPGAVAKDGFEGIQAVALPDGRALAVKISDGGDRARMPITATLLLNALEEVPDDLRALTHSNVEAGPAEERVGKLFAL